MNVLNNSFSLGSFKHLAGTGFKQSFMTTKPALLFCGEANNDILSQSGVKDVPVNVWVKQYETGKPLINSKVVDLATGEAWKTGLDGYARLKVSPGRVLTLVLRQKGYPDTQTASVTVPPEGLTDVNDEITLQVAGRALYKLLRLGVGKPKQGKHHVAVTVSALGRNLHDDKGEGDVRVTLRSVNGKVHEGAPIYLGKMFGKTEWVRPILSSRIPFLKKYAHTVTSEDGGVIFKNVKPDFKNGQPAEYIIEAQKENADGTPVAFTQAKITIFPDSPELINVSPPLGPKVVAE